MIKKPEKNDRTLVRSTFKIDTTIVPLFYQTFYLLVPKIEICLKYVLEKKSQKEPFAMLDILRFLS